MYVFNFFFWSSRTQYLPYPSKHLTKQRSATAAISLYLTLHSLDVLCHVFMDFIYYKCAIYKFIYLITLLYYYRLLPLLMDYHYQVLMHIILSTINLTVLCPVNVLVDTYHANVKLFCIKETIG